MNERRQKSHSVKCKQNKRSKASSISMKPEKKIEAELMPECYVWLKRDRKAWKRFLRMKKPKKTWETLKTPRKVKSDTRVSIPKRHNRKEAKLGIKKYLSDRYSLAYFT